MSPSPTLRSDLLQIYLADHQAGGRGILQRLGQMEGYTDLPIKPRISRLRREVGEEYDWVCALVEQLDLRHGHLKAASARVGELLGRLKLNGRLTSRSPSTPIVELELLSCAVVGKMRLWETLTDVADALPVDRADLAHLHARAERQLWDIGQAHGQLRRDAFTTSS
ncbi:MAG: hypothetical protein WA962_03710 [Ornithinimicrobium sp.]